MRSSEYGDTLTVDAIVGERANLLGRAPHRVDHLHVRARATRASASCCDAARRSLKIVGVHGDRQAELLRDLVVAQRGAADAAPRQASPSVSNPPFA